MSAVPIAAARLRRQFARLAADFPTESEALGRRAFWRLASRYTPFLAVERDGMRLFVSTSDQTIGRRLFVYHRTPELDIDRAFRTLRAIPGVAARLERCSVLEVGANIGSHTVEWLRHYGADSVVAVEPNPDNCELLRQNVLANGLSDRVTVLPIALSDHEGMVSLELSATNSGDHRVRVEGTTANGAESRRPTIEVRAATLDSLAGEELDLARIGLLWMDAQGHEAHILHGARQVLESDIPIMMEYWPYGLRRAGGLELLHRLIAEHYSHVIDVSPPHGAVPRVIASDRLAALETEYGWLHQPDQQAPGTDLVLIRNLDAGLRFNGW